ncbi:hypothetical protein WDV93_04555 [Pantoea ananatis]
MWRGFGLLSRRHGLTVDHLHAIEIITVDKTGNARAVVARRDPGCPNHDLWWNYAGGGGGQLGIVTKFWFRSPDAKEMSQGKYYLAHHQKCI